MRTSSRVPRSALLAAVLLAVAVVGGCSFAPASSGSGGVPTVTASQPTAGSASAAPPATAAATSPASQPASTTPAASQPAGGPVPAGFAADSVTFVSAREAFVLGTAPCENAPCTSILRTLDRGATWRGLPAPVVPIGQPGQGSSPRAWGIRFATPMQGFVFGDGLWVTTDGGEHWTQISYPGGQILSLATIDGQVLALTTTAPTAYVNGTLSSQTLYRRPLGGGAWQQVAVVHVPGFSDPTDLISTQGGVATVVDDTSVLVTGNGGLTYSLRATPCTQPGVPPGTLATPTTGAGLALVCTGQGYTGHVNKTSYVSADLGAHWTKAGTPPSAGEPDAIAAGTPATLVIASASAASWLFSSGDSAASWATAATELDGGVGWADLGFTTPADGVIIHGPVLSASNSEGRPGQLMLTSNGGATWYQVPF
ncbi:MAG TPA: hypothetical protein VI365_13270 [Trebonia sp.]